MWGKQLEPGGWSSGPGFSRLEPTEFWASGHPVLFPRSLALPGATGLVLGLPGVENGRGRGSPAPFSPKPGPSSTPHCRNLCPGSSSLQSSSLGEF